jgi:beta-galactosidase
MKRGMLAGAVLVLFTLGCRTSPPAEVHNAAITTPARAQAEGFKMGESRRPDGTTITVDSRSLRLDGRPWTPVMGEFHYSRYPETEWREELLKMKAGGIDIVATYVFWIHHEEVEGQFDWSGRRNLRGFIETAGDVGLKAVVRCGPWCHGEVRNGGLPDWILNKGWKVRSDDPNYLAKVRILYGQIAAQLQGLLWKDGGPVIGIQLENEYHGPAEHLLTLKRLARQAGLDVPLYTRTGWPDLSTPMPFGEIVPLYGVYAEGFWDRELTPMPGSYPYGFQFSPLRSDSAIATDQLGRREAKDAPQAAEYPYLTCEIGGGMMNSYHRRILIYPADVEATTLVKLGSGSTLPGYYMYHGGVNPEGKVSTLQESQATAMTNWNDMPVKCYDFQAPLGQYGQIRPQYHLLRRLHLFLHEWGPLLARTSVVIPERSGPNDVAALRWAVRSDGDAGFVFVNNYERLKAMPAKPGVQFNLALPAGSLTFPLGPVTIPADSRFFWPFHLELGPGVVLTWATAQPICAIDDGGARTIFFAQTPGVPGQFAFASDGPAVSAPLARLSRWNSQLLVRDIRPGTDPAITLRPTAGPAVRIVLLDELDSLSLWKGGWQGRDRVFLTRAGLVLDGDELRLTSDDPAELTVGVYPAPTVVTADGEALSGRSDGVFRRFTPARPRTITLEPVIESVQSAGPPRVIPLGKISQPVAAAPEDADFDEAAVWRVKLPQGLDLSTDPILRVHYVGDVARVLLDGRLITDDFYNGRPLDIGLRRHAPEILTGELRIAILPIRKDAPIYMAQEARPDFGPAASLVALHGVEIIPHYQANLTSSR